MYMSFYRLREEPFGITPDPRFLYLSASHRDALAAMVYGVSQRKGFVSVIGEVGTGKTIVLRAFLERLDRSSTAAICLLNPLATFEQIINEILPSDFKGSTPDLFRTLQEWLINEYREGRNVVVAIDEAQRMSAATLERLRLLSNLETAKHKLIQIILVGQPELERKLQRKNLRQLWQRIAVRATILPLTRTESHAYIEHRLSKAVVGASGPVFARAALRHLVARAHGNPRRLNVLCDRALVSGFARKRRPVPLGAAWDATSAASPVPRWRQSAVFRALVLVTTTMALAAIVSYVLTTQSGDTATEVALADSEAESYVTQPDEDSR
jgi:general secretion pathway protein A